MTPLVCDFASSEAAAAQTTEHDLPYGVQIMLRAQTGLVSASIEAQLAREIYAFQEGADVIGRYGFSADDAGLLADEHIRNGFSILLHTCIRAQALIAEWNLVDENQDPIPINPETLRAFFQFGPTPGTGAMMMAAFQRLCDAPALTVAREKKDFGSSPSGATGAAANTAPPVGRAATRAPSGAKSKGSAVRKTKTGPRRPKASRP